MKIELDIEKVTLLERRGVTDLVVIELKDNTAFTVAFVLSTRICDF